MAVPGNLYCFKKVNIPARGTWRITKIAQILRATPGNSMFDYPLEGARMQQKNWCTKDNVCSLGHVAPSFQCFPSMAVRHRRLFGEGRALRTKCKDSRECVLTGPSPRHIRDHDMGIMIRYPRPLAKDYVSLYVCVATFGRFS